jgi:tetratricopeptide (TPR) repeat protein
MDQYRVSIGHHHRIKDTAGEAIIEFNLGRAYQDVLSIRDLGAAEAAYQRSLAFQDPDDALGRLKCIHQIGMVHHDRFLKSRQRGEPVEAQFKHAQAAERQFLEALALCPPTAITDLGSIHSELGILYDNVGQTERAREHYEKDMQICEQTGDRYRAGRTRFNMALMYLQAAKHEATQTRQRDLLLRAQAYAEAALRDFQHYQGRAAADEVDAQRLLAAIAKALE